MKEKKVAIVIPCLNEASTIAKVVDAFAQACPMAEIHVIDNLSSDATIDVARATGRACVSMFVTRGKGNVVAHAISSIEADLYVFVDGDDTYPAEALPGMLEVASEADMVVGNRLSNGSYFHENERLFHSFGNRLVRWLMARLYGADEDIDVMSGYRVLSREFARSLVLKKHGFEVETEMTIRALKGHWRIAQVDVDYRDRPSGSVSKVRTLRDGVKILWTILEGLFWETSE